MKDRSAEIMEQIATARAGVTNDKLPPGDPDYPKIENINEQRSDWAAEAIVAFAETTGSDLEDALADLIGDLHHFCDRHGMDMSEQIERGRDFYQYETQGEEEPA